MSSAGTAVFLPDAAYFTSSLLCVAEVPVAAGRLQGCLSIPERVQGLMPELCPVGSQRSLPSESWGRLLRCLLAPSPLGNCS